jgi:hypothetical protein
MQIEEMSKHQLLEIVRQLPLTADGVPITPGMTIFKLAGKYVDEREVVGPYGRKALLYREPARHGAGAGDCHCLAETCYSTRQAAEQARDEGGEKKGEKS